MTSLSNFQVVCFQAAFWQFKIGNNADGNFFFNQATHKHPLVKGRVFYHIWKNKGGAVIDNTGAPYGENRNNQLCASNDYREIVDAIQSYLHENGHLPPYQAPNRLPSLSNDTRNIYYHMWNCKGGSNVDRGDRNYGKNYFDSLASDPEKTEAISNYLKDKDLLFSSTRDNTQSTERPTYPVVMPRTLSASPSGPLSSMAPEIRDNIFSASDEQLTVIFKKHLPKDTYPSLKVATIYRAIGLSDEKIRVREISLGISLLDKCISAARGVASALKICDNLYAPPHKEGRLKNAIVGSKNTEDIAELTKAYKRGSYLVLTIAYDLSKSALKIEESIGEKIHETITNFTLS